MRSVYVADLVRRRARAASRFRTVEQAPDSALFKVCNWKELAQKRPKHGWKR